MATVAVRMGLLPRELEERATMGDIRDLLALEEIKANPEGGGISLEAAQKMAGLPSGKT